MAENFFVGTRKGLFEYARQNGQWQIEAVHFLGDPVSIVLPAGDGTLYAGLNLGHFGAKLHRRRPGSTEWEECSAPQFPAGAVVNAGPPLDENTPPETKPASLEEIWALETGGTDQPGVLWAGTIPGGLFRSIDEGDSWQLVESLWNREERNRWFGGGKDSPGIHSICIDPRDSNDMVLGISCGGVWKTADGGETWRNDSTGLRADYMPPDLTYDPVAQDPHRLVQCADDPNTMWIQHHNGVFLSRDRGLTWQELDTPKPSVFGFAVAVHPHDANTAWFAPAQKDDMRVPVESRVVVSRTVDGGESFEVLGQGLPEHEAYDIIYRHALDVDAAGATLAMGSTTGGLWVSSSAGDDWSCLSMNLPPIYCVRFATGA